jgi:hypothetical protein
VITKDKINRQGQYNVYIHGSWLTEVVMNTTFIGKDGRRWRVNFITQSGPNDSYELQFSPIMELEVPLPVTYYSGGKIH